MAQVNEFLSVGYDCAVMDGNAKLFPECLPVENVTIKGGDIKLRNPLASCVGTIASGTRPGLYSNLLMTRDMLNMFLSVN